MKAKEAIKIIGDWISEETHKRNYNKVEIAKLSEALIYLKCITEQQDNIWIPVSERLPEEEGSYLVYDENHQTTIEWRYTDKDTEWDNPYFATDHNVLAWMPLPEPWKE